MEIGSREWQNLIKNGAQQLGIAIDKRICTAFATHAAECLGQHHRCAPMRRFGLFVLVVVALVGWAVSAKANR